MALPKLNDVPKYELVVPSTGKTVSYRPYLVKEEKVLMIAFETGDQRQSLGAIVDTIKSCVQEEILDHELTTFDIEYMFTQIRSRSVGETATVLLSCSECNHKNERDIDVSSIKVNVPKEKNNIIELTPSISVEMKYPSYVDIKTTDFNQDELTLGFELASNCISAILTEEERIDTKDIKKEEVLEFIESMTQDQFKKVGQFLESMPALMHKDTFTCEKCGTENTVILRGMQDFLS
jgi:DNA-directed RNA polymerase subunit M/transcription elongation factor TFIIS